MRNRLLAFASVLMIAANANAAVIISQDMTPTSDPQLTSVTLRAVGTAGEVINSFAGINIPSGVHNVQPGFGQPSTHKGHWTAPNGDSNAAWAVFDTYLLFNPADAANVVGFIGAIQESNDNTDPAGLALQGAVLPANEGLGFYRFSAPTDQLVITPAAASSNVPFLQVVLPTGTTAFGDFVLFDAQGARYQFDGVPIGIPEPATLAMAGMGLLGMVAIRRRKA
jgi:PEP-CTERM motif